MSTWAQPGRLRRPGRGLGLKEVQTAANPLISGRCVFRPAEPALGKVVIADRGYLSKYAYQYAVLAADDQFDEESAHRLMTAIFRHIARPDVFVLLECPLEAVTERLVARGYMVNAERLNFIRKSQALMNELAAGESRVLRFNTSEIPAQEICDQIMGSQWI